MSILLAVWSYVDLIRDLVWGGKSQPIATRLALCFALGLGGISIALGDGGWGDLAVTSIYALLSFAVIVISLFPRFRAAFTMTAIDVACLGVSMAGATSLLFTGRSGVGVAFAIGADLIAYLPTFRAAKQVPHTQPVVTYAIGLGAAVCALVATYLDRGITGDSMMTIYFIAIDSLLPAFILIRRKQVKKPTRVSFEQAI